MICVTGSQLYIQLFTYRLKVFFLLQVQQVSYRNKNKFSVIKNYGTLYLIYISKINGPNQPKCKHWANEELHNP